MIQIQYIEQESYLEKLKVFTQPPTSKNAIMGTINQQEEDDEIKKLLLDDESILVPDGIGIVKAARMIGKDIKERILIFENII